MHLNHAALANQLICWTAFFSSSLRAPQREQKNSHDDLERDILAALTGETPPMWLTPDPLPKSAKARNLDDLIAVALRSENPHLVALAEHCDDLADHYLTMRMKADMGPDRAEKTNE